MAQRLTKTLNGGESVDEKIKIEYENGSTWKTFRIASVFVKYLLVNLSLFPVDSCFSRCSLYVWHVLLFNNHIYKHSLTATPSVVGDRLILFYTFYVAFEN